MDTFLGNVGFASHHPHPTNPNPQNSGYSSEIRRSVDGPGSSASHHGAQPIGGGISGGGPGDELFRWIGQQDPDQLMDWAVKLIVRSYQTKTDSYDQQLSTMRQSVHEKQQQIASLESQCQALQDELQSEQRKNAQLMDERSRWESDRNELLSAIKKLQKELSMLHRVRESIAQSLTLHEDGGANPNPGSGGASYSAAGSGSSTNPNQQGGQNPPSSGLSSNAGVGGFGGPGISGGGGSSNRGNYVSPPPSSQSQRLDRGSSDIYGLSQGSVLNNSMFAGPPPPSLLPHGNVNPFNVPPQRPPTGLANSTSTNLPGSYFTMDNSLGYRQGMQGNSQGVPPSYSNNGSISSQPEDLLAMIDKSLQQSSRALNIPQGGLGNGFANTTTSEAENRRPAELQANNAPSNFQSSMRPGSGSTFDGPPTVRFSTGISNPGTSSSASASASASSTRMPGIQRDVSFRMSEIDSNKDGRGEENGSRGAFGRNGSDADVGPSGPVAGGGPQSSLLSRSVSLPALSHVSPVKTSGSGGSNSNGGQTHDPELDEGKAFFQAARNRLSYEQFASFLQAIRSLNRKEMSAEQCHRECQTIFGPENGDLLVQFKSMLSRHA